MTRISKSVMAAVYLAMQVTAYCQVQQRAKGLEVLSRTEYLSIPLAPVPVAGKLPNSATLEGLFPHVRNQGQLLSCTAWAASYNKAYRIYMANGGGQKDSPERYLQSPSFVYSALTRTLCNRGTPIPSALRFYKSVGSIPWESLPYSDANCPRWQPYQSTARNNSYNAFRLSDDKDVALLQIRNHVVGGDPVIAAINACGEFDNPTGGIIKETSGPVTKCGAHAVLVVGYDDSLGAVGAVRILNSWGDQWGDSGKIWMTYPVFETRLLEAYVDFGPGQGGGADEPWLQDETAVGAPAKLPGVTPATLVSGLRFNIDPKILAKFAPIEGEKVEVSIWSIWLNLSPDYASQIKSVDYYFNHPTFKHNPQTSQGGSSVFLAQWRGYGCVFDAHLVAHLKDGSDVRANFDFCQVSQARMPQ
jgi:cathepsin K